jgi:hypothetical protein
MVGSGEGEMPEKEEGSASFSGQTEEMKGVGAKPDFRVVQPEYDGRLGKTIFKDVGALWKGRSRAGNEFYTMKIGKLKLLVFPNER